MKMSSDDIVLWSTGISLYVYRYSMDIDDKEQSLYVSGINDSVNTVLTLNASSGTVISQKKL